MGIFKPKIYLLIFSLIICSINPVFTLVCTNLTVSSSATTIKSHTSYDIDDYPNNYDACWYVTASDSNSAVELKSKDFDVQPGGGSSCDNDRLQVYDSFTKNGLSIKFCGKNIFEQIYSYGPHMYILFETNDGDQRKGFKLELKQADRSKFDSDDWSSDSYNYNTGGGFSVGGIIGITVGVTTGICIVACKCCKKKNNQNNKPTPAPPPPGLPAAAASATIQYEVEPSKPKPNALPPIKGGPPPPAYNDLFDKANQQQTDQYGIPPPPVYNAPAYSKF